MYSLPCLLEPSWQIAGVAAGDVARFTLIIFCHLDDGPLILTVTLVHSEPPWRGSLLSCGRLSCDSLAWMLCGASDHLG